MKKEITPEQARIRLATLCAAGEQCEYDLLEKAVRWGLPKEEGEKIVEYLREHRFVDNHRYAMAFARDKFNYSGWGPRKIAQALYLKRIPRDIVAEAVAQFSEGDDDAIIASIRKIAVPKLRSLDLSDPKDKQKLYRFLASRGFSLSQISKALSSL